MRKAFTLLTIVLAALLTFSCATTLAEQDDVNKAFEKVYNKYQSSLILEGAQSYTVVAGDTLSDITAKFYGEGKGNYFPVIMLASNEVVLDPNLIEPGMTLTIPDLQKNINNANTRAKMKSYFKDVADIYQRRGNAGMETKLLEIAASL